MRVCGTGEDRMVVMPVGHRPRPEAKWTTQKMELGDINYYTIFGHWPQRPGVRGTYSYNTFLGQRRGKSQPA
jgi:hypothetical protein